ncbi:hypothetical protein GCM10023189_37940 [Nibrella saemangeumensis]|uniref:AAA+ ATPase domain-containing protein n=1 Tax=Nibrella saemangeumensis TaxID=1084526 RepID=A0ABP8N7T9_9BACT
MKQELLEYLTQEKEFLEEDIALLDTLPTEVLVEKGVLIENLQLDQQKGNELILLADINNSRFRPGDKVTLQVGKKRYVATVLENFFSEITILLHEKVTIPKDVLLSIRAEAVQLLNPMIEALKTLEEGGPGWTIFETLSGLRPPRPRSLFGAICDEESIELLRKYQLNLSENQEKYVLKALKLPSVYAIQGPPGTGKSFVLALIADILTAKSKRVVVLAPTHQAVNNCLATIRELNEAIRLIKIGEEIKSSGLPDSIERMSYFQFNKKLKGNQIKWPCIVGMTFYSAVIHLGLRASSLSPNVILMDEAGQLPFSFGALVGLFGAGSTIFFGDDAQLPPIYHERLEHHPLSKSVFQQFRSMFPDQVDALDVTYRLNTELCDYIGSRYYPNAQKQTFLKPATSAANRYFERALPMGIPDDIRNVLTPHPALTFFDNRLAQEPCTQLNEPEALKIAELTSFFLQTGLTKKDIAIVTPFRRQALAIRKALVNLVPADSIPVVDTVERLQGASVEVAIVSLATTDPAFFDQMSHFLLSPNRLNVALSRAKRKVVVFGPTDTLTRYALISGDLA